MFVSVTKNGTQCITEQIGTKIRIDKGWVDYNSLDIPIGARIGIKTMVNQGDYYDGIWNIVDERLTKHAEWTSALNTSLAGYYNFNEASWKY